MSDLVCKVCGNEIVRRRSLPNSYGHLHGSDGSHRAEPSQPGAAASEGKEWSLAQPSPLRYVPSITTDSTAQPVFAAQPQPAGTEIISKEIRSVSEFTGLTEDQTLRFVGCLLRVGLEIFPSAKLAALQQSHDACYNALNEAATILSRGDKPDVNWYREARDILFNAEKLRAAK